VGRLPTAALLVALAACQQGTPARLFTDGEVAALQDEVLARVAQTRSDCVDPALRNLFANDHPCANAKSVSDDSCRARVAALIARAKPGSCSPRQVGMFVGRDSLDLSALHLARFVSAHASENVDSMGGLRELLSAVEALQALRRGYVSLLTAAESFAAQGKILERIEQLLQSPRTAEELDELARRVDALIAAEPQPLDVFLGESRSTALHFGLAGIRGPSWTPPGGRSDLFGQFQAPVDVDALAVVMAAALASEPIVSAACGNHATLVRCATALPTTQTPDVDDLERSRAKYLLVRNERARLQVQRELVERSTPMLGLSFYVGSFGISVARLSGLRMQLEALRTGACPQPITPPILGEPLRVQTTANGVDVLPPSFVQREQVVSHIRCP
jgi:hypothetical protein